MNHKKNHQHLVKPLSRLEIEEQLKQIGSTISAFVEKRSTPRKFAYETEMSITQLYNYAKGGDMLLSTFLRILHGLNLDGIDFFKEFK